METTPSPAMRTASVAFQPAPMSGREMLPRMMAAENIGPIASACATAWIVVRFFLPNLPLAAPVEPVPVLITSRPPSAPACPVSPACPLWRRKYNVRTSNVNHRTYCRDEHENGPPAPGTLGRGARVRRDPFVDRGRPAGPG